ncbi:MAG: crossover junction endodeoxyribonuclease RuvC [Proteobacteria bacterium]|jgi:crossover junction endodeoxyribonuclease RuvC|nr:crossover junction endodeoxyribonuclease RuvC [Pseudomonadota bacterium]
MRVLGIDPGSVVTGIGVVESRRGRLRFIDGDYVRTSAQQPMGDRLLLIYEGLIAAIERNQPEEIAIEAIFRHKSSESALRLGQARGVALLAAAQKGYQAAEYNPMTVKKTIGAHGRADKGGIARMVSMLLNIDVPGPKMPLDVSDALAIAITHCLYARSRR